ncbi:MAG: 6-pyruvoyl-tetrahydropterin synthase-related protein [Candidatus Margulisbacteria bacterium]|nr:6-pyruvoyl-tetrahydropterin synthase-related protein [Candidatus Margulisiibacteriota bacterium]
MENRRDYLVDLTVLGLIALFLLSFFEPRYLFSLTTTTGGDTGSHYPTAVYLKEVLLPQGKIMGWVMGNYAGFPLFYHYFPLPFLLMVLLSFALPMQIAFKLVSVLGVFLLPLSCYLAFRLLRYPFPIPIGGALFTLPFLFLEANSMWGANIPSTLAGEISYGIGISLAFLFMGTLYAGLTEKKWLLLNGFLVFLLGLSHGYSLIFAAVTGSYFLFNRIAWRENLWYLFRAYGLGFLLLAFWLFPFIATLPYVTEYVTAWYIKSVWEVFPRILIPGLALSLTALFLNLFDRRTWYFLYNVAFCLLLYYLGPRVGVLDIRFIPILQIFAAVYGATALLVFVGKLRGKETLPFIVFLVVILWVAGNTTFIKGWIAWNYSGFEGKNDWPLFQQINAHLRDTGPGRVVYEHSPLHNTFGTERAFESLPYFAGRDTLEGLYMQSSPSSPFIFYIQSEVSRVCSGPFPQYHYSSLNLPAALPGLKLFNVTQYIVRSPEAKKMAAATPGLKLERSFGDYQIYRLTGSDGRYVVPLDYQPVYFATTDWKRTFYDWFRDPDLLAVPLIYDPQAAVNDLAVLPRQPLPHARPVIREKIGAEEISFDTNLIGHPHLIKLSYHPNWQVEGAKRIHLVSPSFMLVYPDRNHVRLYFGKTAFNYIGEGLTLAGLLIWLISGIIYPAYVRKTQALAGRPGL